MARSSQFLSGWHMSIAAIHERPPFSNSGIAEDHRKDIPPREMLALELWLLLG